MAVTKISTITVGSGGSANLDFTSIAGTPYTDLMIVVSARSTGADPTDVYMQFNGVTTATYSMRRLYGTGSGGGNADLVTNSTTGFRIGRSVGTNYTSSTFSSFEVYIPNYAGSTTKSASSNQVEENNASTSLQLITGCSWSGTAAITQVTLKQLDGNSFAQYTTATLYGITKGSSGGVTVS